MWTRSTGTNANPNMPMIRIEHYFPDVDDPLIVHLALNEYRHEWDNESKSITDMKEISNHCTYSKDIVLKPVFKTKSRQYVEKRFFFQCKEALEMSKNPHKELGNGFEDDIYFWCSSLPSGFREVDPSNVLVDQMFDINIIGKMANMPPKTSDDMPENRGVYMSTIIQNDMKIGIWSLKLLAPVIHINLESWGKSFREYLDQNLEKLAKHAEDLRNGH